MEQCEVMMRDHPYLTHEDVDACIDHLYFLWKPVTSKTAVVLEKGTAFMI